MRRVFLLCAILGLGGAAAHADTISTFSFIGSAVTYGMAGDFNTVSGSVTIDTTTGVAQSLSFTAAGVAQAGVKSQMGAEVYVGDALSAFSFSAASLIGYNGSTFNLRTSSDLYVGSTTLTSTATTPLAGVAAPEPSSLALLGTGLIGAVGAVRRRRVG